MLVGKQLHTYTASDEHRPYSRPRLRHFFSHSRLSRPSNSATMSSTRRPDVPESVYKGEKWSAEPSAKKRKGNETWAKNIAKKQRDSGQEYVSVTTKATKPAASVGRRYNAHAHNCKNRYYGIKLIIQERGRIGDSIGIQYLQI